MTRLRVSRSIDGKLHPFHLFHGPNSPQISLHRPSHITRVETTRFMLRYYLEMNCAAIKTGSSAAVAIDLFRMRPHHRI